MLAATGGVKIPCAQHLPSNPHVAEVSVVALKIPAAGFVRNRANAYPTVAFAGKAVAEFHLKVGDIFIFAVSQIAATFVACTDDGAVFRLPSRGALGRGCFPAIEGFTVEDGDKSVLVRLGIRSLCPGGKNAETKCGNSDPICSGMN